MVMGKVGKRRVITQGGKNKKARREKDDKGDSRKRGDEEIHSSEDEEEDRIKGQDVNDEVVDEEEQIETADEKRLRIAKAYLKKVQDFAKSQDEDDCEEDDENEEGRRGGRDSLVADLLKQQQLEESGRLQRKLAGRVLQPSTVPEGKHLSRRHRQSVTAICLSSDDSKGFSASKDGLLVQWNVETGQSEKYDWPAQEASTSGSNVNMRTGGKKQGSKHIVAVAVSSDGRYLASGGLDRAIHLWDTRTREHIQAFPGHRGAVSCLAFRQGTQQLISGSFDRTIKLWSVEDRSYIDTLYGHQSEVIALDCLRQERPLSAGRDRTLRVWKVPEETQLVFRGHAASMDCCCFLSNSEFLSGSDDGCVALWSTMRKKPIFLVKNAHGSSQSLQSEGCKSQNEKPLEVAFNKGLENGHANGNGVVEMVSSIDSNSSLVSEGGAAASWVGAVAVCSGSDLAASGGGDGIVRLWAIDDNNKGLRSLHCLPVKGFVNSLAFAHSGRFILAGVGQEPRLGRWGRIPHVRNGVVQHLINLT